MTENSRRFYDEHVARMLHERFPEYEKSIAVGIAGEGSDCFGYDDEISRDHDFGTGVCLWLTDSDMDRIGEELGRAYNELVEEKDSIEFRNYQMMCEEIKFVLLQVRQQIRESIEAQNAPKKQVKCPYCGATTTPTANGTCEFCGGALD